MKYGGREETFSCNYTYINLYVICVCESSKAVLSGFKYGKHSNVPRCRTKILSRFQLKPTFSKIIQHVVQTRPNCWMMLGQHEGFVSTGIKKYKQSFFVLYYFHQFRHSVLKPMFNTSEAINFCFAKVPFHCIL